MNIEIIKTYLSEVVKTISELPLDEIVRAVETIAQAQQNGKGIFLFGNGGSAATASHFAGDLQIGTISQGKPRIKANALTDNVPVLLAWANDTAYENVFAEQLENLAEAGDIAIAISGSGNSPNVLKAVKKAKSKGAATIGFIGFKGGKLKDLVDISVIVPNNVIEQIEDIHLLVGHIITLCLREKE